VKKIVEVLFVMALAVAMISGCASTGGLSPTAPATVASTINTVVTDAQTALAYATPWLQAAESVASAVCAANLMSSTNCQDVTTASTTANMVAAAVAAGPTAANVAQLAEAMIPVYAATNKAAPLTVSPLPVVAK